MSEPTELELRIALMATSNDPAVARTCKWLLEVLPAHNREIELATARKVLEAACKSVCGACNAEEMLDAEELAAPGDLHSPACDGIRNAILALYPELAQPVEPGKERSDG